MGVKRFIWDEVSDNVLLETDETDTVTARYCQCPETFGELLFQDRNGTKSFYHYDGNASTCNLTDSSEAVTDTTLYTAYGEEVSSSGSTTNPFGYKGAVGYYTNDSTGDIYVRNRSYEPTIGRWMSKDPVGFINGTSLFRAYFVPDGMDPSGLHWDKCWLERFRRRNVAPRVRRLQCIIRCECFDNSDGPVEYEEDLPIQGHRVNTDEARCRALVPNYLPLGECDEGNDPEPEPRPDPVLEPRRVPVPRRIPLPLPHTVPFPSPLPPTIPVPINPPPLVPLVPTFFKLFRYVWS